MNHSMTTMNAMKAISTISPMITVAPPLTIALQLQHDNRSDTSTLGFFFAVDKT
jgi:hypothetical protein